MAKRLDRKVYIAINRAMTRSFDRWAKRNHGISGKKLLAKVASAEGGGTTQRPNVSSAGARGPFQFIPSTRNAYKAKYGLDAWRTNTEAAKAAMIHLKGTGIAGYNPGMPSYTKLVLGQDVDTMPLRTGKFGSGKTRRGGGSRVVGGSPGRVRVETEPGELPSGTGVADLLRQLRVEEGPRQPQQSSSLQAPEHSASKSLALPAGYKPVQSGGGPEPERTSLSDLLREVSAISGGTVDKQSVKVSPGTDPIVVGGRGGATVPGGKGGSGKALARKLAAQAGRGFIGSGERTPQQNAATGGAPNSDHLTTKRNASAVDTKFGTGKTIARRLGVKGWKPGSYTRHVVRIGGRRYSVQILERVQGHYDHTHLGIQYLGGGGRRRRRRRG